MRDTLSERSSSFGHPVTHRPRRDRKGCAFSHSKHDVSEEDSRQTTDDASEESRGPPDNCSGSQHPPGSKSITQPSAEDRKDQIGISEGGKHQSDLGIG